MPAAGRGDAYFSSCASTAPSAFDGMMFVISSSERDGCAARIGGGGGTLRGGGGMLAGGFTRLSFVRTSSSLSFSRPGRFVKGSMILRS